MRTGMKCAIFLSTLVPVFAAFASVCFSAEPVVPGNPNPAIDTLMKASPASAGVFEAQSDGSVRHVQSGFLCPERLPSVNFWNLLVVPSPPAQGLGTDVGCDYGRVRGGQVANGAESKFTIFLVKAEPNLTLNDAFKRYLDEMHGAYPNSRVRGPAVHPDYVRIQRTDGSQVPLPAFQSEADEIVIGNRPFVNELVVGLFGGWIVELRSTYPTEFVAGDRAVGIDIPASSFVWATSVRQFADAMAASVK